MTTVVGGNDRSVAVVAIPQEVGDPRHPLGDRPELPGGGASDDRVLGDLLTLHEFDQRFVTASGLVRAIRVGALTALLGLVFALAVTRTGMKATRLLRALTVLPIITPPFVIGLAVMIVIGFAGAIRPV